MKNLIFILVVMSNSFCNEGASYDEKQVILAFEKGEISLEEIELQYPEVDRDLMLFLDYFNNSWLSYNSTNYNEDILNEFNKTRSTWYYTMQYYIGSLNGSQSKVELEHIENEATQADKQKQNLYIQILNHFETANLECKDSDYVLNFIKNSDEKWSSLNLYNVLKSTALRNSGNFVGALKAASQITYKNKLYLSNYYSATVFQEMNDYSNFIKEIVKTAELSKNNDFILEIVMNEIMSQNLEEAKFLINNNNFNKGYKYYSTVGWFEQANDNFIQASDLFLEAYNVSNNPSTLIDYVWLNISLRNYNKLAPYFSRLDMSNLDWWIAYKLLYLVEYTKDNKGAFELYDSLDECRRSQIDIYLEPYEEVFSMLTIR